jgi:hypothetical protein
LVPQDKNAPQHRQTEESNEKLLFKIKDRGQHEAHKEIVEEKMTRNTWTGIFPVQVWRLRGGDLTLQEIRPQPLPMEAVPSHKIGWE